MKVKFLFVSCPRYTGIQGDKESFILDASYPGSFSAADKEDVVVSLRGCESEAEGRGGTALLQKKAGKWERVLRVGPGRHVSALLKPSVMKSLRRISHSELSWIIMGRRLFHLSGVKLTYRR